MAPSNTLVIHGNEKTMNLNSLVLTNIQSSNYFKVRLYELKTYHQVVDEIYYKVSHLEPWEKGSRKTAGQTGMCGGVRGVGAGGIVSSAFCLLYKLFTLRLTRKQVIGLITHQDSPYIRGLGFMYIRYTQPPPDLWDWYEEYLEDEEEIDVRAGGGSSMTIGEMVRQFMTKLEWYATLFPRIPVPVEKIIHAKIKEWDAAHPRFPQQQAVDQHEGYGGDDGGDGFGEAARIHSAGGSYDREDRGYHHRSDRGDRSRHNRDDDRDYSRSRHRDHHDRHRRRSRSRGKDRRRSRSRDRHSHRRRSRSRSYERSRRDRGGHYSHDEPEDFDTLLRKEKERRQRDRHD